MTNGEKLKEIFPNIDNRLDVKTGIMIVKWADNITKFFKTSWWNAEYKEPTTGSNIPFIMHKEMDIPISECQKAYNVAIEYLRSHTKVKG